MQNCRFTHRNTHRRKIPYTHAVQWIIAVIMLLLPAHAYGQKPVQTLPIRLMRSSMEIEDVILTSKGQARQEFDGKGSHAVMRYKAATPFDVYIVPLAKNGTYDALGMLHASFPAATEPAQVSINLALSPSWSLNTEKYLFLFFSEEANVDAEIHDLTFEGPTITELIGIIIRHMSTPEPYLPSSYHALHGYKILNASVATVLGIITLAVVLIALKLRPGNPRLIIGIMAASSLLYGIHTAADLIITTNDHLAEWSAGHTLDEARGIYAVAERIRADVPDDENGAVYVCRDGANFREKLLRYFAYPVPILNDEEAARATHVLIMSKKEWAFEDGALTCGAVNSAAKELPAFDDGTRYFSLIKP